MNNRKKRTPLDWIVLSIVVGIALVVIALSFSNTAKLAGTLGLNPYLAAGLVEILFGALLFIRGKQRATQRNVPVFLTVGYFISLIFVTGTNMWGLAQEHAVIGSIVGVSISGAMWLMETVLVWLWVDADQPHQPTIRDHMRQAKREIAEEKAHQRIEWMRFEAQKPDLKLIKEARKAEQRRKETLEDGLPEFFHPYPNEIVIVKPEGTKEKQTAQVVPMRQIGFQVENEKPSGNAKTNASSSSKTRFQANTEAREKAIKTAKKLSESLGRTPKIGELKTAGLTDHYARFALKEIVE